MTTTALRSFTLESTGRRALTVNMVARIHRQQWAAHTRTTRELWWGIAKQAKAPKLQRAHIVATPLHCDGRSPQDVSACCPETKAAIDGLVDAGVLPGDGPAHLLSLTFLPPDVCGVDGLRIRVEEV